MLENQRDSSAKILRNCAFDFGEKAKLDARANMPFSAGMENSPGLKPIMRAGAFFRWTEVQLPPAEAQGLPPRCERLNAHWRGLRGSMVVLAWGSRKPQIPHFVRDDKYVV